MTKFDEMPMEAQGKAVQAVRKFLMDSDYDHIEDASEILGCSPRMVWDKIMADAGLPECEPPEFIETEMTLNEALDTLSLPKWIPVPEPGQSLDDDDCQWVTFDTATVSNVETFLAAEPSDFDPHALMSLQFLVGVAKQAKASPDENLLLVAGMIQKH